MCCKVDLKIECSILLRCVQAALIISRDGALSWMLLVHLCSWQKESSHHAFLLIVLKNSHSPLRAIIEERLHDDRKLLRLNLLRMTLSPKDRLQRGFCQMWIVRLALERPCGMCESRPGQRIVSPQ